MRGVSKITTEENIMMIGYTKTEAAFMPEVLTSLADAGVVVDMISQTAAAGGSISFSFTAPFGNFNTVIQTLGNKGGDGPMISGGYAKVYLFGEEMVTSCGVAALALKTLVERNIEIAMITTSDLDISILLRQEDADTAVQALKEAFSI